MFPSVTQQLSAGGIAPKTLGCCACCDAVVHNASQQMSAGGRVLRETGFSLSPFRLTLF